MNGLNGPGKNRDSAGKSRTERFTVLAVAAALDAVTAMHPTVKPVALIADALKDCSARGDIVLDNFAGSGSTLIAAEKCGRRARLIEYSPGYCDIIVGRWQGYTGKTATHLDGRSFEEVERERRVPVS